VNLCVDNPEIDEVLDLDSGGRHSAAAAIGTEYDRVIHLRSALKEGILTGAPRYACSICHVPVYLVATPEGNRFFFRHQAEEGNCPAITRGNLSQEDINALKYNGAKESRRHKQVKDWVASSLAADSDFSDIAVESVVKGREGVDWRKPDVRALYRGRPVVFEIQLSTTFLDVITARRLFYLRQGALLVWVFAEFEGFAHRPLTQNDVFYNNNRNAFLVTEETISASLASGRLQLECRWEEPQYPSGTTHLQHRIVPFQDLTLDWENQQAYYFDFYGPQERIRAELERRGGDPDKLREQFRRLWWNGYFDTRDTPEFKQLLANLRRAGVRVPPRLDYRLLNALYTARMGTPVGYKIANSLLGHESADFLLIAHRIHDEHKPHFLTFCRALAAYGKLGRLLQEDKSGKWRAKYEAAKQKFRDGDPQFQRNATHDPLLEFLFPEVFQPAGKPAA
jgi:FMN phosphatase YigB (HAD superfamily)